jgi:hypothetical protein
MTIEARWDMILSRDESLLLEFVLVIGYHPGRRRFWTHGIYFSFGVPFFIQFSYLRLAKLSPVLLASSIFAATPATLCSRDGAIVTFSSRLPTVCKTEVLTQKI